MPGLSVRRSLPVFSGGPFNWEAYWARQNIFDTLWWNTAPVGDELVDISGNGNNIKITGKDFSTNYIPSTSTAVFSLPDNATLIADDLANQFWFRPTIRNRTTAQLVAYDLSRTIIKYDNTAPYHIRWIGVLKSDVILTQDQKDKLSQSFQLWAWYFGVYNAHGYLKANRPGATLSALQAETTTFLGWAGSEQTEARIENINNLIAYWKAQGVWAKLDVFVNLRAADSTIAYKNWIKNDHHGSPQNAPTFTPDVGVLTAATGSKYIKTDFIPSSDGDNYVQDSASIGCKISGYDNTGSSARVLMGCNAEVIPHDSIIGQTTVALHRINAGATPMGGSGVIPDNGYNSLTRVSAATFNQYLNGVKYFKNSTSDGVPTKEMYVGCSNTNEVATYFVNATFEYYIMTGALTDADELAIRTGYATYIAGL